MDYTHAKKPYRAKCLQWDGNNTTEILEMLRTGGNEAYTCGEDRRNSHYIMIRFKENLNDRPSIDTITHSNWVVIGENGVVKTYSDKQFNIKYKGLK